MSEYRYIFEPYKSMKNKHTCPQCEKPRKYTRYIDLKTKILLPYNYGKCDRIDSCGYYLNPYKSGYHKMELLGNSNFSNERNFQKITSLKSKPQVFIPESYLEASLNNYHNNNFTKFLYTLFGTDITFSLIERFKIGTTNFWNGATVFWLIDEDGNIVGGEVILVDKNGKTLKEKSKNGNVFRYNSWIHKAIESDYIKKEIPIPDWLKKYSNSENPKASCLFGLPQLENESLTKPVAIVESAKTAIIATACLSDDFIWLATGGISYLTESRLRAVKDRKIVLFPDKGAYQNWSIKANELSKDYRIDVSDLLEGMTARKGSDIADYLIEYYLNTDKELEKMEVETFLNEYGYPSSWG